jgi:hypothetical protein
MIQRTNLDWKGSNCVIKFIFAPFHLPANAIASSLSTMIRSKGRAHFGCGANRSPCSAIEKDPDQLRNTRFIPCQFLFAFMVCHGLL